MERVAGIEPAQPAWKAGVLPLNYTAKLLLTVCERARTETAAPWNPAACSIS